MPRILDYNLEKGGLSIGQGSDKISAPETGSLQAGESVVLFSQIQKRQKDKYGNLNSAVV